jgi:hypothetical protein
MLPIKVAEAPGRQVRIIALFLNSHAPAGTGNPENVNKTA